MREHLTTSTDYSPGYILIIGEVLVILFILVFITTNLAGIPTVETFGIVVSAILTMVLILIYQKQNDILSVQSQILGARHQPIVSIISGNITDTKPADEVEYPGEDVPPGGQNDWLTLTLRNDGNEVAADLHAVYLVDYPGPERPVTAWSEPLKHPDRPQGTQTQGGVLPADGEYHDFYAPIRLEEEIDLPFRVAIKRLPESVEAYEFGIVVKGVNTVGQPFAVPLRSYEIHRADESRSATSLITHEEADLRRISTERLCKQTEWEDLANQLNQRLAPPPDGATTTEG